MGLKQISLAIPDNLFRESKEYTEDYGYRNIQEFILDLLRKRVILDRIDRYKTIEDEMKKGKNVKRFNDPKDAKTFLRSL